LEPKKQRFFDAFDQKKNVITNLYILTKSVNAKMLSDFTHNTLKENSIYGSASILPRDGGVFARMILQTSEEAKDVLDIILTSIRKEILRKPFTGTRKY
jgi:hypothetical protein